MCNFEKEFRLCTCKDKEIKHRKNTTNKKEDTEILVWTLYTYKGKLDSCIVGMTALPSNTIDKQKLPLDYVIHQLNEKNCFDFDYLPIEGDYLIIETQAIWNGRIMPFIYRQNKWVFDSYNPFTEKLEVINDGKLIFLDDRQNLPT